MRDDELLGQALDLRRVEGKRLHLVLAAVGERPIRGSLCHRESSLERDDDEKDCACARVASN